MNKFFTFLLGKNNKVNNHFGVNSRIEDMSNSTVTINGVTVSGTAKSIVIKNGRVIFDGKDVTPDSKEINIVINGNVEELSVDAANKVTITGSAASVKTMSGNIDVGGDVHGNVSSMSGNIKSGNVAGSAKTTSGNISKR